MGGRGELGQLYRAVLPKAHQALLSSSTDICEAELSHSQIQPGKLSQILLAPALWWWWWWWWGLGHQSPILQAGEARFKVHPVPAPFPAILFCQDLKGSLGLQTRGSLFSFSLHGCHISMRDLLLSSKNKTKQKNEIMSWLVPICVILTERQMGH